MRHQASQSFLKKLPMRLPAIAFLVPAFSLPLFALDNDLLPDGRKTVELRPGERNPFVQQAVPVVEQAETPTAETEESRLRKILRSIKVGGISTTGKKASLLLGSLILKEGALLPTLIENQSETLKVTKISEEEIILTFVEKDPSVEARQIIISTGMNPTVATLLYGEAVNKLVPTEKDGRSSLDNLKFDGLENVFKGAKESELQGLTDRKFDMMGEQKNVSDKTPDL